MAASISPPSSSASIEDLSRFATSTASSSKTSLDLIVDQEKDMSVSILVEPVDRQRLQWKTDRKEMFLHRSPPSITLPTNRTSSSSEPGSPGAVSPIPSHTLGIESSS